MSGIPLAPVTVGIVLSVFGTVAWAGHYLFIRVGLDNGNVTNAVTVAMLINLIVFVPVVLVWYYPEYGLTPLALAMFVLAGVGSGLFGRLSQFLSTQRVGASRTSPIVASAGLFSTLLAVVVLEERLTSLHFAGILLIVVGVMITSWETSRDPDRERSLRDLGPALALPLIAAFFYGIEPIWVKIGLAEGTPFVVGMAVMILSALVGFFGYRLYVGSPPVRSVTADPGARWYVAAALAGSVAWVAYFAALDLAPVVVVIPIFDSVPLLVVAFSALFMPSHLERVTWRVWAASVAVVIGAVIVTLSA